MRIVRGTIRLPERWRVCALAELRDSTAQLTGGGCAQHSRLGSRCSSEPARREFAYK